MRRQINRLIKVIDDIDYDHPWILPVLLSVITGIVWAVAIYGLIRLGR
jgi:hypothetical protein